MSARNVWRCVPLVCILANVDARVLSQSYEKLFRDVRRCVDLCHRDGVIKDRVEEDPGR